MASAVRSDRAATGRMQQIGMDAVWLFNTFMDGDMKLELALLLGTSLACAMAGCSQTGHRIGSASSPVPAVARMTGKSHEIETTISVARVQEKQGRLREARELFDELRQTVPTNPVILHRLAVINSKLGEYEAANEYFQEAVQVAEHDAELLADYGYSLMLQNRMPESEKYLRLALQESPGDKRTLNNLAMVTGFSGQFDESYDLFRRVGGESAAWTSLGYVHVQRGEGEKASECFGRALTLDQKNEAAAQALVQIAELKQQARPDRNSNVVQAAHHEVAAEQEPSGVVHASETSVETETSSKAMPEFVKHLNVRDVTND